jgi:hypothetical protein
MPSLRRGMQRTGARGPHLNFKTPVVSQNSGANVCFEWQKEDQNAQPGPETSPRNALNILVSETQTQKPLMDSFWRFIHFFSQNLVISDGC